MEPSGMDAVGTESAEVSADALPRGTGAGRRAFVAGCAILAGLALIAFGLGLGRYVVLQSRARPIAPHDMVKFAAVFVLFFSAVAQVGAGAGVLAAGVRMAREVWRRARYPAEPWMWRADWAAGTVKYSRGRMVPVAWVAAVVWNGVLWRTLLPLVPVREWVERGAYGGLACVAVFVLLGAGLLGWAVMVTARWLRHRESVFEMAAVPGCIGGTLAGTVRAQVSLQPEDQVRVRLVCEQSPGLGGTRHALWQPEYSISGAELAVSSAYSAIPITFEIPPSCRPTTWRLRNPLLWRLEIRAGGRGAGYHAEFRVPVFPAPHRAAAVPPDEDAGD